MLTIFLLISFALVPVAIFYAREYKTGTPSLQWPALARLARLDYEDKPPRLSGLWNGKKVAVDVYRGAVRIAALLPRPSSLRIEIGPREEVARRAGMVVPDPVLTGDREFEEKYLARCSDKAAGLRIVDPDLRKRLLGFGQVDILGQGQMAQWLLPELRDPDILEATLEVLTVIVEEMEAFAAPGDRSGPPRQTTQPSAGEDLSAD